jgi:hypothetical protein
VVSVWRVRTTRTFVLAAAVALAAPAAERGASDSLGRPAETSSDMVLEGRWWNAARGRGGRAASSMGTTHARENKKFPSCLRKQRLRSLLGCVRTKTMGDSEDDDDLMAMMGAEAQPAAQPGGGGAAAPAHASDDESDSQEALQWFGGTQATQTQPDGTPAEEGAAHVAHPPAQEGDEEDAHGDDERALMEAEYGDGGGAANKPPRTSLDAFASRARPAAATALRVWLCCKAERSLTRSRVCSPRAAPAKRARGGGAAGDVAAKAAARAAGLCSSDEEGGKGGSDDDDDDDAWLTAGLTDAPGGADEEDAPPPPPPSGRVCQAPQLYSADVEGESLAGARCRRRAFPSRSRHFS